MHIHLQLKPFTVQLHVLLAMRSSLIGSYLQLEGEKVKAFWKILAYPAQLPFFFYLFCICLWWWWWWWLWRGGGGCLTLLEINFKRERAKKAISGFENVVAN